MADLKSIEVDQMLGISKRMVNLKCQNGKFLHAYKKGNRWMISETDVAGLKSKSGNGK